MLISVTYIWDIHQFHLSSWFLISNILSYWIPFYLRNFFWIFFESFPCQIIFLVGFWVLMFLVKKKNHCMLQCSLSVYRSWTSPIPTPRGSTVNWVSETTVVTLKIFRQICVMESYFYNWLKSLVCCCVLYIFIFFRSSDIGY